MTWISSQSYPSYWRWRKLSSCFYWFSLNSCDRCATSISFYLLRKSIIAHVDVLKNSPPFSSLDVIPAIFCTLIRVTRFFLGSLDNDDRVTGEQDDDHVIEVGSFFVVLCFWLPLWFSPLNACSPDWFRVCCLAGRRWKPTVAWVGSCWRWSNPIRRLLRTAQARSRRQRRRDVNLPARSPLRANYL